MQLVKAIDQVMSNSPTEVRYGLVRQMRRAAVSTPSIIAEGAGRNGAKEFLNFIGISRGSLAELETQLQLAIMLGFAAPDHPAFELAYSTGKLFSFAEYLAASGLRSRSGSFGVVGCCGELY